MLLCGIPLGLSSGVFLAQSIQMLGDFMLLMFQGSWPKNTAPSSERCRNAQTVCPDFVRILLKRPLFDQILENRELFESKGGLCPEIWRKCSYGSFSCLLLPQTAATGHSKYSQEESLLPSVSTMDKPRIKSSGNFWSARGRNNCIEYCQQSKMSRWLYSNVK